MFDIKLSALRLSSSRTLATTAIICLGLSPSSLVNATTSFGDLRPHTHSPQRTNENGEVLTQEDAALYRAIFSAQSQTNWQKADKMIVQLKDNRLMGHVLADRYQRRAATLNELQAWLSAYNDLPQADAFYAEAKKLIGGQQAVLNRPKPASTFSSSGFGFSSATGFHSASINTGDIPKSLQPHVMRIEAVLRQGDLAHAKSLMESTQEMTPLPNDVLNSLKARLAASFFYAGDTSEALQVTDTAEMRQNPRALWIKGLSQYKLGAYKDAAEAFKALAVQDGLSDNDRVAAAFWTYRAMQRSGSKVEAQKWLNEAANEPQSFYGLLASRLKGNKIETLWSWRLPTLTKESTEILSSQPAGARALALVQIGQNSLAEEELSRLNPTGAHSLQMAMLALAEKGHMASLALKLSGLSLDDDGNHFDAALYPVPSWQPKTGFHVERALIYALMRHESRFDPLAESYQGACGLMQLMPATAARVSGQPHGHHDVNGECPDELLDPATNISLGQNYIQNLAQAPVIGNNLLLLLAAYNGGPGRLLQQEGLEDHDDPLLFMESLASQETHDYVQQVLIQYWSYRSRLHQPLNSLDQLAKGNWPRFDLHDTPPTREAEINAPNARYSLASNFIQP